MPSDSAIDSGSVRRYREEMPDGLPALPVLVAQGKFTGPSLLVTGGVHGDEYEGPVAIQFLFDSLDLNSLHGQVIGLPVCNPLAWSARSRVSPADGINLNRIFPGDASSTVTARIAQIIFDRFVRRCDVVIDLHSGGVALNHLPLIGWYNADSDAARQAEHIARHFDPRFHPWVLPDVPGVLSYEAHRIGKVAIGAEWHGGGHLDLAGASAYFMGLRHALVALGLVSLDEKTIDNLDPPDTRPAICGDYQETAIGGLFLPSVGLAKRVEYGDELGLLVDELGVTIATVRAERNGIIAGLPHLPLLSPGDRIAYIG